jgi:hypothetical protein
MTIKMKKSLHYIRKETFKLLSGLKLIRDEEDTKSRSGSNSFMQTPDFFNSRLNNTPRKNPVTMRSPA